MISNIGELSIPKANAATSFVQEMGLSNLSNVVGLDLPKYNVTSTVYPNNFYRDSLPRETIRYILNSDRSSIDVQYSYINGSLQMIKVFNSEGSQYLTVITSNTAEMAQNFLSNYQVQSGKSFVGELRSILSKVDVNKNSTTITGNVKLNVVTSEDRSDTTFRWTYTINGIEAPDKCVALRYENGFLKYFVNNWDIYKIGNVEVNLSEQEAIDIAMAYAKTYSWTDESINSSTGIKFNVANAMIFETILSPSVYVDAGKVRSSDLLELYPLYHVWVSLDKFYPGNVYGFNVYIWADTKEVCYIHERVHTMDPPADLVATEAEYLGISNSQSSAIDQVVSNSLPIWVMASAFAVIIFITLPVYLKMKKLPKISSRFFKIFGILLCLLLSSTTLIELAQSGTVDAAPYYGRATVWGSESTGAWNNNIPPSGSSWRKSPTEVTWQQDTASYIAGLFQGNDYSANNYQGNNGLGSSKNAILNQISTNEGAYSRVAVVAFDHGVGRTDYSEDYNQWHYLIEDNYGIYDGPTPGYSVYPGTAHPDYGIYDMDIYEKTSGKTFFAFINTCMSANTDFGNGNNGNGKAVGMPYAWTHRRVGIEMSSDGYHYGTADTGANCYIGFDGGSAALSQSITGTAYPYYYWVYHFFYYALTADYTIHEALDLASHDAFTGSPDFDQSPLYIGYTSNWPYYIEGDWRDSWDGFNFYGSGEMKVYGNSRLKLYQPNLTVYNNIGASFTVDGNYFGSYASDRVYAGIHTIDVNVPAGYQFDHFYYQDSLGSTNIYYHPVSLPINHDGTLIAYFTP